MNQKKLTIIPLVFGSLFLLEECGNRNVCVNHNTSTERTSNDNNKKNSDDNTDTQPGAIPNNIPPKNTGGHNEPQKSVSIVITPQKYGLELSDIPDNLKQLIPENIDWENLDDLIDNYRLKDLVAFQGEANVPQKDLDGNCGWRGETGAPFSIFRLFTNESCSMYTKHKIDTKKYIGLGRNYYNYQKNKDDDKEYGGPNQCDFSRILQSTSSDSLYVTIAPTERTKDKNNQTDNLTNRMKPFFEVVKKENIGIVVDLRSYDHDEDSKGNRILFENNYKKTTKYNKAVDVTSLYQNDPTEKPQYLKQKDFKYPKGAVKICDNVDDNTAYPQKPQNAGDLCYISPIYFTETYTDENNNTYDFIHFRVKNLVDGKSMDPVNFCTLMRQVDEVQKEAKKLKINSPNKIAFHCNGGLGRAPMVMVVRALWNVFIDVKTAKKSVIANWNQQNKWEIDGNINLAAVLKNAMVRGYYARSSFVQTKKQLNALHDFVNFLEKNQHKIDLTSQN